MGLLWIRPACTLPGRQSRGGNRYGAATGSLAVVYKFDTNGSLLWTHQTTTSKTILGESATGGALKDGAVYVVGIAYKYDLTTHIQSMDPYLRKLDPSAGTELWTSNVRSTSSSLSNVIPFGVSADASGAYVVGSTQVSLITGQQSRLAFES